MTTVDVEAAVIMVVVGGSCCGAVVVVASVDAGGVAAVNGDAGPVVDDCSGPVALVATSPSSGGSPKIAPRTMIAAKTATPTCTALGHDRYRLHPEASALLSLSIGMVYP